MKSVELFAGAGGLGLGLHQAGFHPANVIEWDPYCCDTLRENRDWPVTHSDVRAVDFAVYEGKVDLVSGGPPCQPFSLGGRHRAYDDARDMFPEAIRAVREIKPRAFVFENVRGLTRAAFRNYFEYIRLQMEHPDLVRRKGEDWPSHLMRLEDLHTRGRRHGLHYRVVTRVLNAANFGIPQKRDRVFFVGFRDDTNVSWHFPEETHSQAALHRSMLSGEYWDRHRVARAGRINPTRFSTSEFDEERKPWRTVRDALVGLPDPERSGSGGFANHRFQPGAKAYPGHTGSPIDEPAKTLKAGVHGVPGGENMLLKPDGSVRYFTVRESARLQTFPDDFLFHGSWSETMRQLGNAVPMELARIVGTSVAAHLERAA